MVTKSLFIDKKTALAKVRKHSQIVRKGIGKVEALKKKVKKKRKPKIRK
ncbi:MAG: hypothetical protein NUV67_03795 [archaeon]|nr:hypothetical protein [archaeon]